MKYNTDIDKTKSKIFENGTVLCAEQLNAMWDGIFHNGDAIDKLIAYLITELPKFKNTTNVNIQELISFKREVTLTDLIKLNKGEVGDIYKIVEIDSPSSINPDLISAEDKINYFNKIYRASISNNDYIVCIKPFDFHLNYAYDAIFSEYWLTKKNFFEYATPDRPGLLSNKSQDIGGSKTFVDKVTFKESASFDKEIFAENNVVFNKKVVFGQNSSLDLPKKLNLDGVKLLENGEEIVIPSDERVTSIQNNLAKITSEVNRNTSNIQNTIQDFAQIIRMTPEEFDAIQPDPAKFYLLLDIFGNPLYLFVGSFCIAKKGDGSQGTSAGFPYTFPIIF